MSDGTTPVEAPPRRGRGRPPVHGLYALRRTVTRLTTRRLDGRSGVAVAARRFKADLTADLGGDPSRAQTTLIELAARTWVIVEALDDFLMRQPSLVTKKRTVVPVLLQRQQLADSLARMLERLGLERRARDPLDLNAYLQAKIPPGTRTDSPQPRATDGTNRFVVATTPPPTDARSAP